MLEITHKETKTTERISKAKFEKFTEDMKRKFMVKELPTSKKPVEPKQEK